LATLKFALENALKKSGVVIPHSKLDVNTLDNIPLPVLVTRPVTGLSLKERIPMVSPFYDSLKGAQEFELEFPVNEDGFGPFWDDSGTPISMGENRNETVRIWAVSLGANLYRLSVNPIFEPLTELRWGDEFEADEIYTGNLQLKKVILPLKYKHESRLISSPMTQDCILSEKIHSLGGGWEAWAEGVLTISLPMECWQGFKEFWSSIK
jgi:hypothetical protein